MLSFGLGEFLHGGLPPGLERVHDPLGHFRGDVFVDVGHAGQFVTLASTSMRGV